MVLVALCCALPIGCSSGSDETAIVAVGLSTTTTGELRVLDAAPSSIPPVPPNEMRSRLDAALAAKDFCAFYDVVDSAMPDMTDHAAVSEAYKVLAAAVQQARAIVPNELTEDWTVVESAIASAAVAVRRAGGDIGDPAVRMILDAQDLANSERFVERWIGGNCPAAK